MQLFYFPCISGDKVILNDSESKHAIRVLRLKEGDEVELIDGKGGFYKGRITDANPKKCIISLLSSQTNFGKKDFHLHIAIAPTKNIDRTELFLEKCTEIGIDEITPILSEHSERKVVKPERLQKILVSAMKQSIKAYLPHLNELTKLTDLLPQATEKEKFIAHCNKGDKPHLKNLINRGDNVLILIGPEGDFSLEEVQLARQHGFQDISLGNSRLRTETAGMVACHIVNLAND